MVTLYVADISNLQDPLLVPEALQMLPPERQNRIHKMKQEKSRKQSMGVGLLLQKVLALYHMQDSQVFVGEHGKPMIDGLEFSLSHSGDLVLCAVSDKPVGCDVEWLRTAPKDVAVRYFTESEKSYLSDLSSEEYDRAFFRLWTMKESYVKMTGEGMSLPFDSYVISGTPARVIRDGNVQKCYVCKMEIPEYVIAICAEDSEPVKVVWEEI